MSRRNRRRQAPRRRQRRQKVFMVLALDATGQAVITAPDARNAAKPLFRFNWDSLRDKRNATHAVAFINARRCHPERAARLLRQFARPLNKGQSSNGKRRNGKRRNKAQRVKHAEMRARYAK